MFFAEVDISSEPAPNEVDEIHIRQGESVIVSSFMSSEKNPECVGYKLLVFDEFGGDESELYFEHGLSIIAGKREVVRFGEYVDAVPCDGGMELKVSIDNLDAGTHKIELCVYAVGTGNFGLGKVCSEYPMIYYLTVVVD